jgi:adenylate cyclase
LGICTLKGFDEPIRAYSVHTPNEVVTMRPKPARQPVRPSLPANSRSSYFASPSMCGDVEQEYFSDGISEDIITELSRYREVTGHFAA